MKRFFPLFLGLTIICFSFSLENKTSANICNTSIANTLLDICEFHINLGSSSQQCSGMPAELTIANNCDGTVISTVLTANLVQNPIVGQMYPLPIGAPPIYVETEVNGVVNVIGPIFDFSYNGRTQNVNNTDFPIFEHDCVLTFDMYSKCSQGSSSIMFDARLTEANGNTYPVSNYSGSGEMFYYPVFNVTLPEYTIEACAESCNGCGFTKSIGKEDISLYSSQTFTQQDYTNEELNVVVYEKDDKDVAFKVSPNPFIDEINLFFENTNNSEVNIEIIDTNGKVAIRKSISNLNSDMVKINSGNLQSGLYYCRIIANGRTSTKKLIKH